MADLHPIESGCAFQGDVSPEGRPAESRPAETCTAEPRPSRSRPEIPPGCSKLLRSKNIQRHTRYLRRAVRYLEELRKTLYGQESYVSPQRVAPPALPALPALPPLPPEGGEYRLYYVSPVHLEFEKQYFARHNVKSLTQLLEVAEDILASYCGLIRNSGEGIHPLESTLLSMAEVLDIALQSVLSAHELYRFLEPVQTE